MTTPTIIIGLGTSGLYVLENVQKYYYENFKVNKPANVEYLYLETNENNYPTGTPAGNDIQRVYISLDNMANMISGIKKYCNDPKWLPDSGTVLTAGLGAGGIRSCGRLALWGTNDRGDNFDTVIKKFNNAYDKVNPTHSPNIKPTVFVTGSFTGGTASGAFIDFGYLIRHLIPGIKDLYGLFLLPKYPDTMRGFEVMYGNTYGSLYDLEFYNKVENKYTEKWTNGVQTGFETPPYELVQFISQDNKDGMPSIKKLSGLYKIAGLYLFLNIAGIYDKRRERLVDAAGNSIIGKYGTFGLSAIQFPKDNIQDYIASDLIINLLKRLTDSKEYYKNDQKTTINRANIKNIVPKKMDDIIIEAFKTLNTGYENDLQIAMHQEVEKIGKNDITGDKMQYIISLFSSNSNDKFYSKISGNMLTAQKIIVDGIYKMVDDALQNTENLYYAKFVLEDIVEYIDKLLNYWKSLGLSSFSNKWDDLLRNEVQKCLHNKYKWIGEENNVVFARFQNILELMKMHLSIALLVNIKNHITKGEIRIEGNVNELPKIKLFNDLITDLLKVIGSVDNDDSEASHFNFTRRKLNIRAEIEDETITIFKVYPSNSFDVECKKGQAVFENKNGQVRSMKKLKNNPEFNLMDYFKEKLAGKFQQEIYIDLLKDYRTKIDHTNCVEDYDILSFINSKEANRDACINTANKANYPFIRLSRQLPPSMYLPHFIVCSDTNKISTVIDKFGKNSEFKFADTPDEKLELTELKNIIVFYDEKGNFNPLTDITYIDQMKEAYEKRPMDLADESEIDKTWNQKRKAYLTK
ncbi:MAG: tubulin-like doman-containing protein [Bacteroidales bacterium]|jgi:hypothetical protein|nr:tubulin-like doman-containing protein [Bacteroidales bacterium]